jgi:hypothetical protein
MNAVRGNGSRAMASPIRIRSNVIAAPPVYNVLGYIPVRPQSSP